MNHFNAPKGEKKGKSAKYIKPGAGKEAKTPFKKTSTPNDYIEKLGKEKGAE